MLQIFKYRAELGYHRGEYEAALQGFTDALGKNKDHDVLLATVILVTHIYFTVLYFANKSRY